GDVRPLSVRADPDRPAALPGDRHRERPGALAGLVGRRAGEGDSRMTPRVRRGINVIMSWLAAIAAGLVVLPPLLIFGLLLSQGPSAATVVFSTHLPKPVGEVVGGMANAIVGSLILIALAAALGLPLGILGGLYLAESRDRRLPWVARFLADVLNGVPSIVIGIFAYTIIVLPMRRFSALAGAFALAVIMLPIVVRTSEEVGRLGPGSLREAAPGL